MAVEGSRKSHEPLFPVDTYRGQPVDAITASVIRDQEREAARKKAGLSERDVWQMTERSFDPATVKVQGAPKEITHETEARLAMVAGAKTLEEALAAASTMPEVRAMAAANQGGFPLFQRVKELKSWSMAGAMAASGSASHYANHVRLMAKPDGNAVDLSLQVVRHFAGNADYGSVWVHQTSMAYDKSYSDKWYAVTSVGAKKVQELFPTLTPETLADYLRKSIATGEPPVLRG
jgi:hypothetical protein